MLKKVKLNYKKLKTKRNLNKKIHLIKYQLKFSFCFRLANIFDQFCTLADAFRVQLLLTQNSIHSINKNRLNILYIYPQLFFFQPIDSSSFPLFI